MSDSIEWVTGLFEGEGSILWQKDTRSLRLQLKMTDEDIIRRLTTALGGSMYGPYEPNQNDGHVRKPFWMWRIDGAAAVRILKSMYPMLGERRRAAADQFLVQESLWPVEMTSDGSNT